jgi:hypothetical protein
MWRGCKDYTEISIGSELIESIDTFLLADVNLYRIQNNSCVNVII